ncbi:IGR protein motif-domain-containing protein [Mariannaea sp. PMI_226]|nr:IGR protein motif-domain-containing protein [Mariannaea sp. PMI_226]
MKGERLRASLGLLLQSSTTFSRAGQVRFLHKTRPIPPIPATRPFVPDVHTFLTLIGRNLSRYSSKFPSWEALFSLTSPQLKELGIEPARDRRYLLSWMDRYRKGAVGPGGDFKYVKDGEAILKVAAPPASSLQSARYAVNVPHADAEATDVTQLVRPAGYRVAGLKTVVGPRVQPLSGQAGAVVKAGEGMWEHRRGRKIDGGERRRAEVRFKKRSAERRAEREAEMLSHL